MTDRPLNELAHGNLAEWHGIPDGAGAEWVRDELGSDVQEEAGGYLLVWRGGIASAEGVQIWLGDDRQAELVQIPLPRLSVQAIEPLGAPELELDSNWSRGARQYAWPSRGLAVHASVTDIVRILGFSPMAAGTFETHRFATMGRPPRR